MARRLAHRLAATDSGGGGGGGGGGGYDLAGSCPAGGTDALEEVAAAAAAAEDDDYYPVGAAAMDLFPSLMCSAAASGDVGQIKELLRYADCNAATTTGSSNSRSRPITCCFCRALDLGGREGGIEG